MRMNDIVADFQFQNNMVLEFSMQNYLLNIKDKAIKIDYGMDYKIISCSETEENYLGNVDFIVNLTGKTEDNDAFNIYLKMRGIFIGSKNKLSIDKFKGMLEINGTATLSQISRAYITSVTSLSGLPPVNLPMVNIYAMKKYKDNTKDDDMSH